MQTNLGMFTFRVIKKHKHFTNETNVGIEFKQNSTIDRLKVNVLAVITGSKHNNKGIR